MTTKIQETVQNTAENTVNKLDFNYKKGMVEALLFISPEAMSVAELMKKTDLPRKDVQTILDRLIDEYQEREGGFILKEISGGYQFLSAPKHHSELNNILEKEEQKTLNRSSMETLSIICYEQPITLPEIEKIRGISSRNALNKLLLYKFVQPKGKKDAPGRPTLYSTSKELLDFLGIYSLNELPNLEEIKSLNFDEIS